MKQANVDNTIKFIEKKTEYEVKNKIPKLHINKLNKNHKVIEYHEHKKIKALESKKQKIFNPKIFKFRKKTLVIFIIILSIFVGIYLWQKYYNPSYVQSNDHNFKVETQNLSNSDVSKYSSIVEESIHGTLGVKYKVDVEQLHKNGNLIFARGYFNVPNKGDINFDMILKNSSPSSLKINGEEYLKK